MTKFKKMFSFVFALFVSVAFFAGCNLIKPNTQKYYSQTVAEVVYKDSTNAFKSKKFTMKDLYTAYRNNLQNSQSSDVDTKELLQTTIDNLIDRYLLVKKIEEKMPLSDAKIEEVKRETYKNVNSSLASYEESIRKDWGIEVGEETAEEEKSSEPLRSEFTPYEPTYKLQWDEELKMSVLKRIKQEDNLKFEEAGEFLQNITDAPVSAEAMKRFISDLRANSKVETNKKYTDKQLLDMEISRIYNILYENALIEKFQNEFMYDLNIESDAVVDAYIRKYEEDFAKYSSDEKAYHQDMRAKAQDIVYHPVNNAYLNVTHILIKMSPEQNKQIANLISEKNVDSVKDLEGSVALNNIINNTVVTYEENIVDSSNQNKVVTKTISYDDLTTQIKQNFSNNQNDLLDVTFASRAKTFNDFIYKYNDDPGIFNNDFGYYVNLYDYEGVDNTLNQPFIDEARKLHKAGKGAVSQTPVFVEYEQGGYGFHIIMNLGVVQNKIITHPSNKGKVTWEALMKEYTQPAYKEVENGKTLFHVYYDNLQLDENRINQRVDQLVKEERILVNVIKYPNTYKKLA